MIKFSPEQLAELHRELAPHIPPLAPPPHMKSQQAQAQPPEQQPRPCQAPKPSQPQPRPCQNPKPSQSQPKQSRASIPLAVLAPMYIAACSSVAVASVAAPARTLDGVLLAAPLLTLSLGLHALVLLQGGLALPLLALGCAFGTPAAVILMPPAWGAWACCASLSAFFTASAPRGLLRGAASLGTLAVLAAGAVVFAAEAYARTAWGAALVALAIQSAISAGRLRGQRLTCETAFLD